MYSLHTDIEPNEKEAVKRYVTIAVWASWKPVRKGDKAPCIRNIGNRCDWSDSRLGHLIPKERILTTLWVRDSVRSLASL